MKVCLHTGNALVEVATVFLKSCDLYGLFVLNYATRSPGLVVAHILHTRMPLGARGCKISKVSAHHNHQDPASAVSQDEALEIRVQAGSEKQHPGNSTLAQGQPPNRHPKSQLSQVAHT